MEEDITARRAELAYQTQLQSLQAALAYLGIPLMAAFQPYDEDGGSKRDRKPITPLSPGVNPALINALSS